MEKLKHELDDLNGEIRNLESRIEKERLEAERNAEPLKDELSRVKDDKRRFGQKNDFESVQDCLRKEENLKFKIAAQWNRHSMLKGDLARLNRQKADLEHQIKLEEDRIKRKREILERMERVLEGYAKSQNLKKAAVDSNINPDHVEQWLEWGRDNFSETYSYFYNRVVEIDESFRDLEAKRLMERMDSVIDAFERTGSLKEASRIAGVSWDTVQYWHEWGSMGFGEENVYFFKKLDSLKK